MEEEAKKEEEAGTSSATTGTFPLAEYVFPLVTERGMMSAGGATNQVTELKILL